MLPPRDAGPPRTVNVYRVPRPRRDRDGAAVRTGGDAAVEKGAATPTLAPPATRAFGTGERAMPVPREAGRVKDMGRDGTAHPLH
jgi:hypothetical protein